MVRAAKANFIIIIFLKSTVKHRPPVKCTISSISCQRPEVPVRWYISRKSDNHGKNEYLRGDHDSAVVMWGTLRPGEDLKDELTTIKVRTS